MHVIKQSFLIFFLLSLSINKTCFSMNLKKYFCIAYKILQSPPKILPLDKKELNISQRKCIQTFFEEKNKKPICSSDKSLSCNYNPSSHFAILSKSPSKKYYITVRFNQPKTEKSYQLWKWKKQTKKYEIIKEFSSDRPKNDNFLITKPKAIFSPCSNFFVIDDTNRKMRLFNRKTKNEIQQFKNSSFLAFSTDTPATKYLAFLEENYHKNIINIWDIEEYKIIKQIPLSMWSTPSLIFHPNSNYIIFCFIKNYPEHSNIITIFDIKKDTIIENFRERKLNIHNSQLAPKLHISHKGKYLTSYNKNSLSEKDQTKKLWNISFLGKKINYKKLNKQDKKERTKYIQDNLKKLNIKHSIKLKNKNLKAPKALLFK